MTSYLLYPILPAAASVPDQFIEISPFPHTPLCFFIDCCKFTFWCCMSWKLSVFFFSFFLYLLAFPQHALHAARSGLLLWYHSVVPVLFPFMILCNFALNTRVLSPLLSLFYRPLHALFGCSKAGSFAIFSGFVCGFPIGAKTSADLCRSGQITPQEARFLLGFCNNLSPAFLLSYLASDQLRQPSLGPVFLGIVLGSSVLFGIISSVFFRRQPHSAKEKAAERCLEFSMDLLDTCIMDAVRSTVRLGAYLLLFSMIDSCASMLIPSSSPLFLLLRSSIEVSNGLHVLCSSPLPWNLKFIFLNAAAAFGGLSALAQTISIARMDRSLAFYYIKSRVIITLLSILLSVLVLWSPLLV